MWGKRTCPSFEAATLSDSHCRHCRHWDSRQWVLDRHSRALTTALQRPTVAKLRCRGRAPSSFLPLLCFECFSNILASRSINNNKAFRKRIRKIPLSEPISTAACYDWPTRTAKVARAHIVSFTETSEAEAFHDPVSVTQTRRSESAGYNHCCLPESGDGWPRLGNPEMNGVGRITENKWMRRLRSDLRIVLDLILRSDLRFGPAQNKHLVVRTDGHWPERPVDC